MSKTIIIISSFLTLVFIGIMILLFLKYKKESYENSKWGICKKCPDGSTRGEKCLYVSNCRNCEPGLVCDTNETCSCPPTPQNVGDPCGFKGCPLCPSSLICGKDGTCDCPPAPQKAGDKCGTKGCPRCPEGMGCFSGGCRPCPPTPPGKGSYCNLYDGCPSCAEGLNCNSSGMCE